MDKQRKRSQNLYVVQAAAEYMVTLSVSGSLLAKLTTSLGMSDSLTGILSAFLTMGCLFQLLSLFIHVRQVKRYVILSSLCSEILFLLLYLIPLTGISQKVKTVAFIAVMFTSHMVLNAAGPRKTNWLMGLVEDGNRGRFSATKEMFSLFLSIFFSFGTGALFDWLEGMQKLQTAFACMAVLITVCMLIHLLVITNISAPNQSSQPQRTLAQTLRSLAGSRNLLRVMGAFVLYNVFVHIAAPFYATYQLSELGLSLKTISVLNIVCSVVRMAVSRFWGRYADQKSFARVLERCFVFIGAAYLCASAATPRNGVVMFALYYAFYGIAMGGINSSLTNLIFDYMPETERVGALAICPAVGGISGFAATLVFSAVLARLQQNGITLLGMPLYAQQLLSLVCVPVVALSIVYVHTQITRKARRE